MIGLRIVNALELVVMYTKELEIMGHYALSVRTESITSPSFLVQLPNRLHKPYISGCDRYYTVPEVS